MKIDPVWAVGDWVQKVGGDYSWRGRVIAAYSKFKRDLSGPSSIMRYDVQNFEGAVHVFNAKQLEAMPPCDQPEFGRGHHIPIEQADTPGVDEPPRPRFDFSKLRRPTPR